MTPKRITIPKTKHKNVELRANSPQREAHAADPNDGRCFLTNVPDAVRLYHLVATATDHDMLTKLEYVWEMGYQQLHVDTKCNRVFLRKDCGVLFDTDQWLLIPEHDVLQNLTKIYLEDDCTTFDMNKHVTNETYRYCVLPVPALKAAICRFPKLGGYDHDVHLPPYPHLGPLEGHFHPHFAIVNAGQKLAKLGGHHVDVITSLGQIVTPSSNAVLMLAAVQRLYEKWMGVEVPDQYRCADGPSKRKYLPGEEGRDDSSYTGSPEHESLRSDTRSAPSWDPVSTKRTHIDVDDTLTDGGTVFIEDDTDWIEYIHNWQKQGDRDAEGWESGVLNDACDEQLAAYIAERARTPPPPTDWKSWKPTWRGRKRRHLSASDRSQFSSNDWAVFKNRVYLTRPAK